MPRLLSILPLSVFAFGCSEPAAHLTQLIDEEPGFECPHGGVRIETGEDANGDGVLAGSEIADSHLLCAGTSASLTRVSMEPAGENCSGGGARIEAGIDGNGNDALDPDEITSTSFVCASASVQVVQVAGDHATAVTVPTGPAVTALSATITVPASGKVLAFMTAELYCSPAECPLPMAPPSAMAVVWLTTDAGEAEPVLAEDHAFAHLATGVTEALERSKLFPIATAGTHTFHLRAHSGLATYGLYRRAITLVYLAD